MSFLELKVPPPLVGLICAGVMWYLPQITPAMAIGDERVFEQNAAQRPVRAEPVISRAIQLATRQAS